MPCDSPPCHDQLALGRRRAKPSWGLSWRMWKEVLASEDTQDSLPGPETLRTMDLQPRLFVGALIALMLGLAAAELESETFYSASPSCPQGEESSCSYTMRAAGYTLHQQPATWR